MGSLSNNARKLANFAGFYKGIQSAGAAGMWRYVSTRTFLFFTLCCIVSDSEFSLDAQKTPYMTEFASCWGLLVGSMLIASPIIFFKVKESTAVEEDLRFSDETAADVLGDTVEGAHEYDKPESQHDQDSTKA